MLSAKASTIPYIIAVWILAPFVCAFRWMDHYLKRTRVYKYISGTRAYKWLVKWCVILARILVKLIAIGFMVLVFGMILLLGVVFYLNGNLVLCAVLVAMAIILVTLPFASYTMIDANWKQAKKKFCPRKHNEN